MTSTITTSELREYMHRLDTQRVWQHFFRQAPALELATQSGVMAIARDRKDSERKTREYYTASFVSFVETMRRTPPMLRNFYELIRERPCHFYVDFEYYPGHNAETDDKYPFETRRAVALEVLMEELHEQCPGVRAIDVFETDSSKTGKHSRHYVFHVHGHMFRNLYHCGALQRRMQLRALGKYGPPRDNPYFGWTEPADHPSRVKNETQPMPVVDHQVYTRHRLLRVPWATKYSRTEYRPLIPLMRWRITRHGGAWDNVTGERCEPLSCPDKYNPEIVPEVLKEGMVQCVTEEFLQRGDAEYGGVVRLIELSEPSGSAPTSNALLCTAGTRRTRTVMGMHGLEMPGLARSGILDGVASKKHRTLGCADEGAMVQQYGSEALIADEDVQRIRLALPIVGKRKRRADNAASSGGHAGGGGRGGMGGGEKGGMGGGGSGKDGGEGGAPDDEERVMEKSMKHELDEEMERMLIGTDLAEASARMCVEVGMRMCAVLSAANKVPESVQYHWNMLRSLMFVYQLRSRVCVLCNRTHSSNNILMVVLIAPSSWREDPAHPGAPVSYMKCYKRGNMRSTPRALPMYVEDGEWRRRFDEFRTQCLSVYLEDPRTLLAPLLRRPGETALRADITAVAEDVGGSGQRRC